MQKNYQKVENLSETNNSLERDTNYKFYGPKTVNEDKQSLGKFSFSGTSISSNKKTRENDSYNNFISRIKLNYNLLHPKQRIQTIILHSNIDKSINMSESSINDIQSNDISGNVNDNLNTGFILDNSNENIHKVNRRRTIDQLNRVYEERLEKGKEEKNNQSAEPKKDKINNNFTSDIFGINDNAKINLGNIFNNKNNENSNRDKVFLSQNGFIDNPQWMNYERKDISGQSNEYKNKNNPLKGSNNYLNEQNEKGIQDFNINYSSDLSTNMNTNNDRKNLFLNPKNKIIQKEIISSFNNGLNNNSLSEQMNSNLNLGYNSEDSVNQSYNNNFLLGDKFTFKPKERNNYENNSDPNFNLSKKYTFPQNIPNNNALNNFNGKSNLLNNEENESGENLLLKKPKTMINREENMDIIDKNNQEDINDNGYNNNYENNENKNNNIKIVLSKKDDNLNIDKNIYNINKDVEKDSSISITVSELSESDLLKKKSKGKNLLKSFLYGLLFGSTASGIFWLKDEETRKHLYEKIKGINFNSIIKFLKRIFSNPIEYFKKIFSDERMKDYLKVFGLTLGKFFDVFEGYNDWFRLIGIALSVYLCWLIIKSFIKALFKVWKYYN